MVTHDDADAATIAYETVTAVRECARMVGKLGPVFTTEQLHDMAVAVGSLQQAIEMKLGMNRADPSSGPLNRH